MYFSISHPAARHVWKQRGVGGKLMLGVSDLDVSAAAMLKLEHDMGTGARSSLPGHMTQKAPYMMEGRLPFMNNRVKSPEDPLKTTMESNPAHSIHFEPRQWVRATQTQRACFCFLGRGTVAFKCVHRTEIQPVVLCPGDKWNVFYLFIHS